MSDSICPWWLGYFLASPLRRRWQDPNAILSPYVREGMTVLEPGPGMGFFTLEIARLVGKSGRVIAVDIQPKMLKALARRAEKAGVADRVIAFQANSDGLGVERFSGTVDFVLAFAVVHELPSAETFFREAATALKPGGTLLLAEPSDHVRAKAWEKTLAFAKSAGLNVTDTLTVRLSRAVLLTRSA
jgi:ubiquinone/menaquinone biosynthesis C-methylase UbiE